jgi:hypothetical protein
MRLRRILMVVAAVLVFAVGAISFVTLTGRGETTAGACQICGDGYCAKSCENKYTCPRDCGGSTGTTTR